MKYISPLLSEARASIGGATASKNRNGNYFRARVAPIQPRTEAQQVIRAQLASLSAGWRGLSADNIAGWNSLASQITKKDTLGQSYSPTGAQLYVGNNMNLFLNHETLITAPPAGRPDFPDFAPIGPAASAGTPSFTITTGCAAAPTGYIFEARTTPQLSAGISFIGGSRYRLTETFVATAYASLDILDAYNSDFGALVVGQTIGVQVKLIHIASGFASVPASATITVGA